MARKKEVYKVKPLNENKRNIIAALIDEYDIQTADDIQAALRDLLGGTIKSMMQAEMDEHLGYGSYERGQDGEFRDNYRNGTKKKNVRSTYGEFQIDVPQDRNSTFEPQIVKKRQKDISDIDQKIISMYSRGLTTRQISDQIQEIYGFECSEDFISDVTNAMKSWFQHWDVISPIFKFSDDVRKVIYTTNAIESLNSTYKKLNRQRAVFPSDKALLKALYLPALQATKKWTLPLRNWGKVYGEFSMMYEGRIPS